MCEPLKYALHCWCYTLLWFGRLIFIRQCPLPKLTKLRIFQSLTNTYRCTLHKVYQAYFISVIIHLQTHRAQRHLSETRLYPPHPTGDHVYNYLINHYWYWSINSVNLCTLYMMSQTLPNVTHWNVTNVTKSYTIKGSVKLQGQNRFPCWEWKSGL